MDDSDRPFPWETSLIPQQFIYAAYFTATGLDTPAVSAARCFDALLSAASPHPPKPIQLKPLHSMRPRQAWVSTTKVGSTINRLVLEALMVRPWMGVRKWAEHGSARLGGFVSANWDFMILNRFSDHHLKLDFE